MKNLFDFATKELSQDAFLRWLFESYQDEKYGYIGKALIAEFVNLYGSHSIKPEQISDIKTYAQSENIDIVVDFKVDGRDYILAIEDKTTSAHHDEQLKRYKGIVEKWNRQKKDTNRPTILIYYKTHKMDDKEEKEVVDSDWKIFSFDQINNFWSKYSHCGNAIIEQYVSHISGAFKNSSNTSFPNDANLDKWVGYFNAKQKELNGLYDIWVGIWHSLFVYFCVRPKGRRNDNIPYLEIRSRDCIDEMGNKMLNARILLYNVHLEDEQRNLYKTAIEKTKIFHSENNKEQIGSMLKRKQKPKLFKTVKEFEDALKEAIEQYLSIIGLE